MKKCIYCGADMEDQAKFCSVCGNLAQNASEDPYPPYGNPNGLYAAENQWNGHRFIGSGNCQRIF